jgi:hypothetical protein
MFWTFQIELLKYMDLQTSLAVENISEWTAGSTKHRIKYANRNSNNNYFKISRNIHEYLPNIRHLVEGA